MSEKVVVLGASDNPERYSWQAVQFLLDKGHQPIPVSPTCTSVLGIPCLPELDAVRRSIGTVDTLTVYVNPDISSRLADAICNLDFRRAIFNPGAENPTLAARLQAMGRETLEACTLVLLRTGQF